MTTLVRLVDEATFASVLADAEQVIVDHGYDPVVDVVFYIDPLRPGIAWTAPDGRGGTVGPRFTVDQVPAVLLDAHREDGYRHGEWRAVLSALHNCLRELDRRVHTLS